MKATTSILRISIYFIALANSLGQATFEMSNYNLQFGVDAPIFDSQGVPLEGPRYLAELWGGATADSLAPAIDLNFTGGRLIVPFIVQGYFFDPRSAFLPSVLASHYAWLRLHAWDSQFGGTFEEAAARGVGGYGSSGVFLAQGGNPGSLVPPGPLIGLQSFSLLPVIPEPGVPMLFLVGLTLLLWRVRVPK